LIGISPRLTRKIAMTAASTALYLPAIRPVRPVSAGQSGGHRGNAARQAQLARVRRIAPMPRRPSVSQPINAYATTGCSKGRLIDIFA
jgi:hypothetical protein